MLVARFSLPIILGAAVFVWGVVLYISGIELSWDYIKPYSIAVTLVGVGVASFEKAVWAWRVVSSLHNVPYLKGTWHVELQSTYKDPVTQERRPPVIGYAAIRQTYSTISIRLMTKDSNSALIASDLVRRSDGTYELAGVYQSDPQVHLRGSESEIHYGAFKLRLVGAPVNRIEGHYWTDRNTGGTIIYSSWVPEIADSFEEANEASRR